MSNTKHTPGPWKAEQTFYNDGLKETWNVVTDNKKQLTCIAKVGDSKTDALILAASLEMKEAIKFYLKGVTHFFKCINWGRSPLDADAIVFMNEHELKFKAAIKKATE